jgi:multidrug efflux pump subunit AcrA (membrane-fusion protein)
MNICSPENGFVVEIRVQDGASVTAGTVLVRMDTDKEEKHAQRLATMQAIRDVMARKYSGDQLDAQRKLAQVSVDITSSVYTNLYTIYLSYAAMYQQTGTADMNQVLERLASAQTAQMDSEKAKSQQQKLEFSISNWLATNDLVKAHMEFERTYIEAKKARMQIAAPIAGKVALQVAVGSFVKRGHVILTISA